MRRGTIFILLSSSFLNLLAQDTPKTASADHAAAISAADTAWKKGCLISVSFNQISLTNWAAGGQNALSGSFTGNFFINYNTGKHSWNNTLDMAYGIIENGSVPTQKNLDKIELNSKYGLQARKDFFYSCLINAKTQFAPGYNYPNDSTVVSRFLAPGYITAALGMDYMIGNWFSLFLSPATGRLVIVEDQQLANEGQFGVNPAVYSSQGVLIKNGQNIQTQFGAYLRTRVQKNIAKNVNLMTVLSLFNNYTDPKVYQRANTNVDWQFTLNVKIAKLLTFNLFTQLLYDNNINIPTYGNITVGNTEYKNVVLGQGPKTQFQEAVGFGLTYVIKK